MVAMAESLFSIWLAYFPTWVVRFMLVPVMLVTAALSSSVVWATLVNPPPHPDQVVGSIAALFNV